MATRKQRKRSQKERRHEYETVWVDSEGNEMEEPPEGAPTPATGDSKAKAQPKRQQQSSSRATRTPLPPSWRRAAKRSVILGIVIFVLFALLNKSKGSSAYLSAFLLAFMYTAIFIPFQYYLDRFAYNRFQRKAGEQPQKQPRKR